MDLREIPEIKANQERVKSIEVELRELQTNWDLCKNRPLESLYIHSKMFLIASCMTT